MQKKINYINAIVQWHEDHIKQHVIFKVGKVNLEDDMHVFGYLKSEDDIEELAENGNQDFKVLEHWKGIRPEDRIAKPCDADELDAFFQDVKKSSKPSPE